MILCRAISCAYVQHLEWREKWRPEYLRDEWKAPPLLERYGAFGFLGYDLEGSAVFLVDQGGTDLKGILSCISKEDYMRWGIQIAEKGLLEGRRSLGNGNGNGNGNGPAYQFVFIVDLHGWNFSDVFFKPGPSSFQCFRR
ncbi:unnamed protein product [Darwinula stevensoni]|uniref:Uncharacterized protein n=1 Tax=Darwinula stevensoni TaxID=69355 RepID=A0A7R9FTD0_9CRUS|nr:unnamed protein product [Darwinula stevensoni]CAG0904396.1 unnamed protein product [Darwinula stevensoni]